MKQVVCREDIQAEMDILCRLQTDVDIIKSQLELLKDRVDLLEAKARIDVGIGTPIDAPIRTGDAIHSYWGEAIPDRIHSDGHFDINDDGTVTYVRD